MSTAVHTYEQAIEYLYGRINFERARSGSLSGRDFKLDRMRQLLARLGNPQEELGAIHIAGTKGKGSTAAMVAGMLSGAGERVGLFTSPHLFAFEERMTVDGVPPGPQEVVDLVNRVAAVAASMERQHDRMSPTFFEITTAMAWLHFLQHEVDLAVLEVGLGGRLDATNLCRPYVTVITNISRDHTELLGRQLSQIAREKAGIVKAGVPLLSGVTDDEPQRVIEEVCRDRNAPIRQRGEGVRYWHSTVPRPESDGPLGAPHSVIDVATPRRLWRQLRVPILGEHQAANAALAVGVVDELCGQGRHLPPDGVHRGLAGVRWPIRIEVLGERPTVIVDAAHNGASVAALIDTLNATFAPRRRILVFGATGEKDVSGMLRRLVPEFDAAVFTRYVHNPRAMPVETLCKVIEGLPEIPVYRAVDPPAAWILARELATADDLICVTGSFFLAAEMREFIVDGARHGVRGTALLRNAVTPKLCG